MNIFLLSVLVPWMLGCKTHEAPLRLPSTYPFDEPGRLPAQGVAHVEEQEGDDRLEELVGPGAAGRRRCDVHHHHREDGQRHEQRPAERQTHHPDLKDKY